MITLIGTALNLLTKNKWVIISVLMLSSLTWNVFQYKAIGKLELSLNHAENRLELLTIENKELKEKEVAYKASFETFKSETLKKQDKLLSTISTLQAEEKRLNKQLKTYWNSAKFTGQCENDISILKEHAIKLRGERK